MLPFRRNRAGKTPGGSNPPPAGTKHRVLENTIEVVSKPHLMPNHGVASFLEMLTYCRVCCAF